MGLMFYKTTSLSNASAGYGSSWGPGSCA